MTLYKKVIAITAALALLLLCVGAAAAHRAQNELKKEVIRLHVIANSDSPADQELKLLVRDAVMGAWQAEKLGDIESARLEAIERLPLFEAAARKVIEEYGQAYDVSATITECYFPTREYEGFALPAGNYEAVRVVIGEGRGKNWWCVMFPPLCSGAVTDVEDVCLKGSMSRQSIDLITPQGGYRFKFKTVELFEGARNALWGW